MSEPSDNDALLSPDARAIVRELRRLAETQERIATALEAIAPATAIKSDEGD